MSILEAMSHGLPVIARDVGGLREIIDDSVDGFLLPRRDAREFANKILDIEDNTSLKNRISAAAKKKIEQKFSADSMANQYLAVYQASL